MSDPKIIAANFKVATTLISKIVGSSAIRVQSNANPLWQSVDKQLVIEALRSFVVHPLNVTFHPVDLARFLEDSSDPKLAQWDVVIPNGNGTEMSISSDISLRLQKRKLEINDERNFILINEKKMRVGSRGIEKEGLTPEQVVEAEKDFWDDVENKDKKSVSDKAYRRHRTRPLLILHFLDGMVKDLPFVAPKDTALTAIGLSFPSLATQSSRVTYRINLVEIRNLFSVDEVDEGEDEIDNDEN